MLEVTGVRKQFGGLVALDGVDLAIGEGEIVGLIGPNGAGKTTLFDVITGVTRPEPGGTIAFDGRDLLGLATHEIARLGLVRTFQLVRVFEGMTVLENAAAGALFGSSEPVGRAEAGERGREALAFVGLADRADEAASALPAAGKRRLELARALATGPRLVLVDEFAGGLTPAEVDAASRLVERIREERGVSVFWIEHLVDAIMGVADRVVVLGSGRKIAEGPPAAVRRDPAVREAYLGEAA